MKHTNQGYKRVKGSALFERVLFATDFSDYARKALDCLAEFPGTNEILLLHVVEKVISPWGGGEVTGTVTERERDLLRQERWYLETIGKGIKIKTLVTSSTDIPGTIIDVAEEKGIPLIAIGARGNSIVEGILLGSVSMAILRRSRTNVLIMRPLPADQTAGSLGVPSCKKIFSKILCPVDFSSHSHHAIDLLLNTNEVVEVILLTVISKGESPEEIRDSVKDSEEMIESIRDILVSKGFGVRAIVTIGNPGREIVRIANHEEASLIWMSSVGRGWFSELILGSTAYDVAMNAGKPVLIIRKTNHS